MVLKLSDILWLVSFPALMSVGQILFRHSALVAAGKPMPGLLLVLVKIPAFHLALLLYGVSTILWVWLLGRYPLSIAYPFASLAIVAVPVLEMTVFRQSLPSGYWLGLGLITIGVFVIVRTRA